ncbi:DUF2218 domain-containing protein [Aliikangiella sp. IMCC44359]|uniref:DUF2218 domain-containing protein n=1 Tax=Aliikangiella sp. IMCC44359 TaxID=3459125 RepID=UPI00403AD03B
MNITNQFQVEPNSPFLALSTVIDIDASRMIKRLCQHFSHKINVEWSDNNGYIEFEMGVCHLDNDNSQLNFCCGANSEAELIEIVDCIESHFLRFGKKTDASLKWNFTESEIPRIVNGK